MSNMNYGMYPGNIGFGGVSYAEPQQTPVMNQLLTPEEVTELQKTPQQFSTKLTRDEYLRAVCTHKDYNNRVTLEKLPDGRHHCTICQADFYLLQLSTSDDEVSTICNNFNDLFQTIKTYYGNAPESLKDLYVMNGFILKMRYLWNVARQYFERVTNASAFGVQQNPDQYGFQLLNNIFGGGVMGGMMPGMNPYGGVPGAGPMPGYYGQPTQQPPMAQYAVPPQGPIGQPQMPPNNGVPNNNMVMPPNYGYPVDPNVQFYTNHQAPMYGYSTPAGVAGYANPNNGMPSGNPIGFVDQSNNDFTRNQGQQQQVTANVSMPVVPGQTMNAGTQPAAAAMPEPPKNPNVKDVKANVNKKFAG